MSPAQKEIATAIMKISSASFNLACTLTDNPSLRDVDTAIKHAKKMLAEATEIIGNFKGL